MLGFAESFLPWTASTLIPAFVGLLLIVLIGMKLQARYVAAFAFGILFWFFVDTITGAASLDVNSGFSGGVGQLAIVGLFVIGLFFFFLVDRNRNIFSPDLAVGKYGLAIPVLVASAIGAHGFSGGGAFGGTARVPLTRSPLETFCSGSSGAADSLSQGSARVSV